MKTVTHCCNRWNEVTAPYELLTDRQHASRRKVARAIERYMKKHFVYGKDWKEFSNGMRWPIG